MYLHRLACGCNLLMYGQWGGVGTTIDDERAREEQRNGVFDGDGPARVDLMACFRGIAHTGV